MSVWVVLFSSLLDGKLCYFVLKRFDCRRMGEVINGAGVLYEE